MNDKAEEIINLINKEIKIEPEIGVKKCHKDKNGNIIIDDFSFEGFGLVTNAKK